MVIVHVELAIGSLRKVPHIHEGRGGLQDNFSDNAHDNATRHDRQHGTKNNPMSLVPTMKDQNNILAFHGQLWPQLRRSPHTVLQHTSSNRVDR